MAILNDIVDERGDVHRECGNADDDTTIDHLSNANHLLTRIVNQSMIYFGW